MYLIRLFQLSLRTHGIGSILVLGRFGFDGDKLEKSGLFEFIKRGSKLKSVHFPKLDITFMTAHASKGLGYDNVIIINGRNETYGFPSKIEDDPVLSFVIKGDRSIDYAEERRLFYVAMTRTKNRVYCIAPENNPSEFLLEIEHKYKNVSLRGIWNEEPPQQVFTKKCPICGYPLQYRYKNSFGLRLYICTNEPEICGFMTNEIKAGKLSICKCDKCRSGYLIVKPSNNNDYFLGCTNYNKKGTGCRNSLSKQQYYEKMGYTIDKNESTDNSVFSIQPINPSNKKENITIKEKVVNNSPQLVNDDVPSINNNHSFINYKEHDLRELIEIVLSCLENISAIHFYGVSIFVDTLYGINSKKIISAKINEISEFGVLRYAGKDDLIVIVKWLIENGYILQTKGKYPVLHLTYKGRHLEETLSDRKIKSLVTILIGG